MAGIQSKINKLKMAIASEGRVVKINIEQFYSKEKKRLFVCYKVSEVTPKKYEIKDQIKELKKKKANKEEVERLKKYVKDNYLVGTEEFFRKIDLLLFLVKYYKEKVTRNE